MQEAIEEPKEITFPIGDDEFTFLEIMLMIEGKNEEAKMCLEAFDDDARAEFEKVKKDFQDPDNKEAIAKILDGQQRQNMAQSAYMKKLHNESAFGRKKKRELAEVNRKKAVNKKSRKQQRANKKRNRK